MIDREQMVYWAQEMERRGLVHSTAGNISTYDATEGTVWVTPTSLPYSTMTVDDLVALDLASAQRVRGHRRPTSEVPLHLSIYRNDPTVRAIVHTHSLYATMFAVANRPIPAGHYTILALGNEVPVVPYARFGSKDLADNAIKGLGRAKGILLQNHGVVAVGGDLRTAFVRAETVEWLAHLVWGAQQLGQVTVLTPEQLAEVMRGAAEISSRYTDAENAP